MKLGIPPTIAPAEELGAVHFIGVGGAGLSAIARIMVGRGIRVSGSDAKDSPLLAALASEGITTYVGHAAEHLGGVDSVIASTAVKDDNAEVLEAQRRGLRLWPRSAGLQSVLMGSATVAVAGTHGKTTTTAMLTMALRAAGLDPSFAIGAEVANLGTNAHVGTGDVFVAEADESDGAFLVYTPAGAVVTNVDADHLDNYGTVDAYRAAFAEFVDHVDEFVVLSADDRGARDLAGPAKRAGLDVILAGWAEDADLQGHRLRIEDGFTRVDVTWHGVDVGVLSLRVPGRHYASDALLAVAAGLRLGASFADLAAGIGEFTGANRRMQLLGEAGGIRVYDSYAHHPVEIAGDLEAARSLVGSGRLVVCFQSHLVSRTRIFGAEMGRQLDAADVVVVAEIYLAREEPDPAVTPRLILDEIHTAKTHQGRTLDQLAAQLFEIARPGDLVLTLGAGDITTVGPQLLSLLGDA
ncbi:UDP-N-acetylmuramate--L-alanine ligase [soil metagenome]